MLGCELPQLPRHCGAAIVEAVGGCRRLSPVPKSVQINNLPRYRGEWRFCPMGACSSLKSRDGFADGKLLCAGRERASRPYIARSQGERGGLLDMAAIRNSAGPA